MLEISYFQGVLAYYGYHEANIMTHGLDKFTLGLDDKGKMVIYYMTVSLCLFSILVYIFVVLCLFYCSRVILEGNGRKEQKLSENEKNRTKLQIAEKLKGKELAWQHQPLALAIE